MKSYKIASIAGDGIGKEVLPESLKILKETAKKQHKPHVFLMSRFSTCTRFHFFLFIRWQIWFLKTEKKNFWSNFFFNHNMNLIPENQKKKSFLGTLFFFRLGCFLHTCVAKTISGIVINAKPFRGVSRIKPLEASCGKYSLGSAGLVSCL